MVSIRLSNVFVNIVKYPHSLVSSKLADICSMNSELFAGMAVWFRLGKKVETSFCFVPRWFVIFTLLHTIFVASPLQIVLLPFANIVPDRMLTFCRQLKLCYLWKLLSSSKLRQLCTYKISFPHRWSLRATGSVVIIIYGFRLILLQKPSRQIISQKILSFYNQFR